MSLRAHWRYAVFLARHKWFVFRACRRLGVSWLGVLHDLSKLRPDEWGPYADYFYGGHDGRRDAFDRAWLLHIHRNRHHPQFWVLRNDTDGVSLLEMPERYVREMVADWLGAGMAIKGHGWDRAPAECYAWWKENRDRSEYAMHLATRDLVEKLLWQLRGWP